MAYLLAMEGVRWEKDTRSVPVISSDTGKTTRTAVCLNLAMESAETLMSRDRHHVECDGRPISKVYVGELG